MSARSLRGSELTVALSQAKEAVMLFFAWWSGELASLVPRAFRDRFRGPEILIEPQLSRLLVRISRAGREGHTFECADGDVGQLQDVFVTRGRGVTTHRAVLALSADRVLHKTIVLPSAVRQRVHDAVRYQISRISPFRESDILFATHVVERRGSKDLRVAVAMVLKRDVESLQNLVAQAGVEIGRIAFIGTEVPMPDLLIERRAIGSQFFPKYGDYLLSMLGVGLFVLALCLAHRHVAGVNELLVSEIKKLKPAAEKVAAIAQDSSSETDMATKAIAAKNKEPSQLAILDTLAGLFGDDVRVTEYRASGRTISLSGFASNATELLAKIDDAREFAGAKFTAPVTHDLARGLDRFSLTFDLRGGP